MNIERIKAFREKYETGLHIAKREIEREDLVEAIQLLNTRSPIAVKDMLEKILDFAAPPYVHKG